jgi:CcmD family protein
MNNPDAVKWLVMAVPLIVWIGVFCYLLTIDRSLRRLEANHTEEDDL